MRLKKENLEKACQIIHKIKLNLSNMSLFFPLDLEESHVDELGMPINDYKAETFYGNTLLPGVMHYVFEVKNDSDEYEEKNTIILAYAQTTEIFTFNLSGFLNLVPQEDITKEEKDFILKYEVCLVKNEKATISNIVMDDLFETKKSEILA